MQSLLYLILIVSVARTGSEELSTLRAPTVVQYNTNVDVDPAQFHMRWRPVFSTDENDPVLGYKVVYRQERMPMIGVGYVGELSAKNAVPESDVGVIEGSPVVILCNGTDITLNNIFYNLEYEIAVQAYTKKGEGPLSKPFKFQIRHHGVIIEF